MKKKTFVLAWGLLFIVAVFSYANGSSEAESNGDQFITIHWMDWAPTDVLAELSKDFTAETGIEVVFEKSPPAAFSQKYNVEMIAHSDAWDIIIGDSQDVGTMAIGGHYVEITDWVKENGVDKSMTPASMTAYAEFPKGSKRYYSVPVEGDALGWAYRKDLFEDPENMAAFKAKYGYKLDVPRDWNAMLDIAEFFHDPDNNFYGIAIFGDNGYDSLVMFGEQLQWSFGGDLGDFATYQVEGILNSPGSVAGLEFYKNLYQFVPPAFSNAFYLQTNDAFTAGIVPFACNYFAFFPALSNSATNPYADVTGYFACPPQVGVDGVERRFSALGGMGASVVSYSKKQDLAMKWLEWFIRPDVQKKWAAEGGFSCNIETISSQEFLDATPYNFAFKESMEIFRDFWSTPEYGELLESYSKIIGNYIIRDQGTAKEALDELSAYWTEIFKNAGYLK